MNDKTDRQAREEQTAAEFDRYARRARDAGKTAGSVALLIVVLLIAALLVGFNAPRADAATRGRVDVCVMKSDTPRSWTRGLQRQANREFDQRIRVKRIPEDRYGGCEAVVWTEGRVAVDQETGLPSADPRYSVATRNVFFKIEINVGAATPRRERKAVLIRALREGGVR